MRPPSGDQVGQLHTVPASVGSPAAVPAGMATSLFVSRSWTRTSPSSPTIASWRIYAVQGPRSNAQGQEATGAVGPWTLDIGPSIDRPGDPDILRLEAGLDEPLLVT